MKTQIVHLVDGLDIKIKDARLEMIFAFDENDNFIQRYTHPYAEIFPEEVPTLLSNTKETVFVNEECFFYYSYWAEVSYSHYMTGTLPKLLYYDRNHKLVIPRYSYHILCREILETLGIKDENILVLEDNVRYVFRDLKTSHHDYHGPGGFIHQDMYTVCGLLRSGLKITQPSPHRKVYLKRDGVANTDYGNSEVGHYRKITNEEEVMEFLKSKDFEIITLGDKTFHEKVELLKNIEILITPLGANCMNLIFSNGPKNLLFLSNDRPVGPEYFINLCTGLNNQQINPKILIYPSLNYNEDPKNSTNSPFRVELSDIKKFLGSI